MQWPFLGIAKNNFGIGAVQSNLSLLIKQLRLPKESYLCYSSTWTRRKQIPSITWIKSMCIHTHIHILNKDKGLMEHCNVIYLQHKVGNLSVQWDFCIELFRCLDLFSLNLLSLLVSAWNGAKHSGQLCPGVIRKWAARAGGCKSGWFCWGERNISSQSALQDLDAVLMWRAESEIEVFGHGVLVCSHRTGDA